VSTEGTAREIDAAAGGQTEVFVADLSDQSQVRRLADQVLQRLGRINVLINNAGGLWNTRHLTADGLERTFALDHLAPFLLTNLLWDRLRNSAPARVGIVSSNAHYSGAQAYSQSKLANVLASAPELGQATGWYFTNGKPKRSAKASYDQAVAARLWQVSADLAGLTPLAERPCP
jgi:NAD(P)-dependent dehydrogenase (short-subunit alcohol dehydrogenase family)